MDTFLKNLGDIHTRQSKHVDIKDWKALMNMDELDERTRDAIENIFYLVACIGFAMAMFNAVVHSIVAINLLWKPEKAKWVWESTVYGRRFETPGVPLKYLLSSALFEGVSVAQYIFGSAPERALHVYAFQLFTIGGVNLYDLVILSRPRQVIRHFFHTMYIEFIIAVGMYNDVTVGLGVIDALQVWLGCKVAGVLWAYVVVAALRLTRIAKFQYDPSLDGPAAATEPQATATEAAAERYDASTGKWVKIRKDDFIPADAKPDDDKKDD